MNYFQGQKEGEIGPRARGDGPGKPVPLKMLFDRILEPL
jgi:hypothetical protein